MGEIMLTKRISRCLKPGGSFRRISSSADIVVDPMPLAPHTLGTEHLHGGSDADVPIRVDERCLVIRDASYSLALAGLREFISIDRARNLDNTPASV